MADKPPTKPPAPPQDEPTRGSPVYSAEQARGARIVLNTPLRRWIFFGGLAGLILLPLILFAIVASS